MAPIPGVPLPTGTVSPWGGTRGRGCPRSRRRCWWLGPVRVPPFVPRSFPRSLPSPRCRRGPGAAVHSRPPRAGSGAGSAPRAGQWEAAAPRVTRPRANGSGPGLNFCHGGQVDTSRGCVRRAARGGAVNPLAAVTHFHRAALAHPPRPAPPLPAGRPPLIPAQAARSRAGPAAGGRGAARGAGRFKRSETRAGVCARAGAARSRRSV